MGMGMRALLASSLALTAALAAACPPDDEGDDELTAPPPPTGAFFPPAPPLSQCELPTNKPLAQAASPGAIYFGTRAPTLVPLDEAQQLAVVAVGYIEDVVGGAGAFCTGTLVADDVVLTAQHCTDGFAAFELAVAFGIDDFTPLLAVPVVDLRETDEDTDIAVLRLERAPRDDIDVTPLPLALAAIDAGGEVIGTLVEAGGYGETHDGTRGRYFVSERVADVDDDFITVDGEGVRGVCFGDSGGPLLRVSDDGDVRVFGVLSFGDPECMNSDNFSRVDVPARRAIVEQLTGPTAPYQPQPCPASLSESGACSVEQAVASFCAPTGFVAHEACALAEICADDGDGDFRCVPASANACGAVTRFGGCDADTGTLAWCDLDGGRVVQRDCAACGEKCRLASPADGFACVPDECGGLDLIGVCDGDVARWCNTAGLLEEKDCAADGQICDFLGPALGNFCYDAEACQGFDYQGQCDGSVLTWCEDNSLEQVDCADDGSECVFLDEETGFICE